MLSIKPHMTVLSGTCFDNQGEESSDTRHKPFIMVCKYFLHGCKISKQLKIFPENPYVGVLIHFFVGWLLAFSSDCTRIKQFCAANWLGMAFIKFCFQLSTTQIAERC